MLKVRRMYVTIPVYILITIVNAFLHSFLGGNQLYTTNSSQDIENHAILSLQGPTIQKVVF